GRTAERRRRIFPCPASPSGYLHLRNGPDPQSCSPRETSGTMRLLRVPGWLAALALTLPTGCGGGPAPADTPNLPEYKPAAAKVRVAFVSNNPEAFWTIAEAGARKAERDLKDKGVDVEVIFRRPDQGDAARQKQIIDQLLNQDIQAISVSVIDPK